MTSARVDAAVIGGGPAGLSAAKWIARYRKSVMVFDAREQRNRWTDRVHGYLGSDPIAPATLLERARAELLGYPSTSHLDERVRHVDGSFGDFHVQADRSITARALVLATGVVDVFPEIEGFFEHYGADVFHCPSCDGYEAEGRHGRRRGHHARPAPRPDGRRERHGGRDLLRRSPPQGRLSHPGSCGRIPPRGGILVGMTWSRPGSQRRRRPSPSRGPAPVPLRLLTTVAVAVLVSAACATDPTNGAIAPDPAPDRSRAAVGIGPDDIVDVVPKDRIPALDDPGFVAVDDATWLAPQEPVVALEINGEARAYPLQIMTWHEIVNDEVGGVPVAVTFCPLCNSAVAYERPTIHGEVTTFGVSGKLVHSNLVMYDRATDSLWPQTTGVAVMGELRGQRLDRHLARIVAWERFGQMFPDAVVLSRATGFDRPYGDNPYPGYDDVDNPPFLFRGKVDGRLAAVERVLGVRIGGRRVAFPYLELERRAREGLSVVNDAVGDEPIVVVWSHGTRSALDASSIAGSRVVGAAAAFSRRLGDRVLTFTARGGRMVDAETNSTWNVFGRAIKGRVAPSRLSSVDSLDSFWFAWAAFFPDTVVWPDGR